MASVLAQQMAQQMAVGQTAEELAQLDQQACPICGITFFEFRSQGRLGCPHDYICFPGATGAVDPQCSRRIGARGEESQPLAEGERERTQLIRLRREMAEAVGQENYERASELRDQIRRIEVSES